MEEHSPVFLFFLLEEIVDSSSSLIRDVESCQLLACKWILTLVTSQKRGPTEHLLMNAIRTNNGPVSRDGEPLSCDYEMITSQSQVWGGKSRAVSKRVSTRGPR